MLYVSIRRVFGLVAGLALLGASAMAETDRIDWLDVASGVRRCLSLRSVPNETWDSLSILTGITISGKSEEEGDLPTNGCFR